MTSFDIYRKRPYISLNNTLSNYLFYMTFILYNMTFMKLLYLMRLALLKPLHDAVNTLNLTQSVSFSNDEPLGVSVGHTTLIPNNTLIVKHLNEGCKVLDATSGKLVFASKVEKFQLSLSSGSIKICRGSRTPQGSRATLPDCVFMLFFTTFLTSPRAPAQWRHRSWRWCHQHWPCCSPPWLCTCQPPERQKVGKEFHQMESCKN